MNPKRGKPKITHRVNGIEDYLESISWRGEKKLKKKREIRTRLEEGSGLDDPLQLSGVAQGLVDKLQGRYLLAGGRVLRLLEEHRAAPDLPLGALLHNARDLRTPKSMMRRLILWLFLGAQRDSERVEDASG